MMHCEKSTVVLKIITATIFVTTENLIKLVDILCLHDMI